MKGNELQVGQKYQHVNGICMYVGSEDISYSMEQTTTYAIFFFGNSTDKVMIPHSSLHLIEPLGIAKTDLRLTDMTAIIIPKVEEKMEDEEISICEQLDEEDDMYMDDDMYMEDALYSGYL